MKATAENMVRRPTRTPRLRTNPHGQADVHGLIHSGATDVAAVLERRAQGIHIGHEGISATRSAVAVVGQVGPIFTGNVVSFDSSTLVLETMSWRARSRSFSQHASHVRGRA